MSESIDKAEVEDNLMAKCIEVSDYIDDSEYAYALETLAEINLELVKALRKQKGM